MICHALECDYISPTTGETIHIGPEEIRYSDTHWGKYNNGLANYLAYGCEDDESTGESDWIGHFQRFGKRILHSDDRGFQYVTRFATVDEAKAEFDLINQDYCNWLDQDDDI